MAARKSLTSPPKLTSNATSYGKTSLMSPGTPSAVFIPLLQNLKIGVHLSGAFQAEGSWTGELCRCVFSRCSQHSRGTQSALSTHFSSLPTRSGTQQCSRYWDCGGKCDACFLQGRGFCNKRIIAQTQLILEGSKGREGHSAWCVGGEQL